jgi:hypothetical protein
LFFFPAIAQSPCFHSHSKWSLRSGASWGSQFFETGAAISASNWRSVAEEPFRRDLAVT